MYQINGEDVILEWLGQHSTAEQEAMLAWLPKLAADPRSVAGAERKGPRDLLYTATVPDTSAFVDYLVADQFQCVLIKRVTDVVIDGDELNLLGSPSAPPDEGSGADAEG